MLSIKWLVASRHTVTMRDPDVAKTSPTNVLSPNILNIFHEQFCNKIAQNRQCLAGDFTQFSSETEADLWHSFQPEDPYFAGIWSGAEEGLWLQNPGCHVMSVRTQSLANQELVTLVTIGEHGVGCQYDTSSGGTCHDVSTCHTQHSGQWSNKLPSVLIYWLVVWSVVAHLKLPEVILKYVRKVPI